MGANDEILEFLINHDKLYKFVTKIKNMEEILRNESMKNLFLASLITADIDSIEDLEKQCDTLQFILDNIHYLNLDESELNRVTDFAKKGMSIVDRDYTLMQTKI